MPLANWLLSIRNPLQKNQAVKKRIVEEIEKTNKVLAPYETIKRPELLPREWTIENGEMTPKLSFKRKVIMAANKELVDKIFGV